MTLEKTQVLAALDTGSSITAISLSLFNKLRKRRHLPMHPSLKSILVANASPLRPSGWTKMQVTLNGKIRNVHVDIIPDFMFDFLVGWPSMKQWETTFDTRKDAATIANEVFPFVKTTKRSYHDPNLLTVVTTESVRIPAACSIVVSARIPDSNSNSSGVIVTDPELTTQAAVFVGKGIPVLDDDGNTEVLIANMGEEDVLIPSQTQVAKFSTKDDYEILGTNPTCIAMPLHSEASDAYLA